MSMNIIEEVEDDEFNYLLTVEHHTELIDSLKVIATAISDIDMGEVVKNQIKELIIITQNISKVNSKEVSLQIKEMRNDIVEACDRYTAAITNRLLPDTFYLVRDRNGNSEYVKVNYKEASKINN